MFEMERPEHMSGIFDDDYDSFFSDDRYHHGNRQQERVPVPVQHQPVGQQQSQFQYQMPVPIPSGIPNRNAQPYQPEKSQHQPTVSSLTQIPVHHIPVGEDNQVECANERMIPVDVEHVAIDPRSTENENVETMQEPSTSMNPGIRKQTSLIVSDDHATPIPLAYGHEPAFHGSILEDVTMPAQQEYPRRHEHTTSHESPSMILDDNVATTKPMTFQQARVEPSIAKHSNSAVVLSDECSSGGIESGESGELLENDEKIVDVDNHKGYKCESPAKWDMATATRTLTSTKSARKIPIASTMDAQKAQRPALKRYTTKTEDVAQDKQTRHPQPHFKYQAQPAATQETASSMSKVPMPQPHIVSPQDNYTTPRPPATAPKPQWVDPRITEALKAIEAASAQARELGTQVDALEAVTKDRTYHGIEEQLTKLLLKLDGIDSMGDESVRTKRKACIVQVQQTLDALELKFMGS